MAGVPAAGSPVVHARASSAPAAAEGDASRGELEALYTRGEQRFFAGDLDGAIEAFSEGLSRLSRDGDPRLRSYFAVSLAIAHLDRHDRDGDAEDLKRGHALLVATVEQGGDALKAEPRLEALARRNLDRARAALGEADEAGETAETADADPDPVTEASNDPVAPMPAPAPDPVEPAAVARRRAAGIGLLVSGTALFAGGIAIVVDGATLERRARAIAEDPPTGRQKEYIDQEVPRLARIRYAIAGPVLAVGVGLLVGGAILLHRAQSKRRVVWSPWVGPRTVALSLRGTF